MPVHRKDGRPNGLLEEPGYPPVTLRIERANSNSPKCSLMSYGTLAAQSVVPGTAGNGKLVLVRTPFHVCRCAVDAEQHQSRLPDHMSGLRVRSLLPHIGVTILSRGDDAVRVGGPVDGGNELVMLYAL